MSSPTTPIIGFGVANAPMNEVVCEICGHLGERFVAYALHVGGLNERHNQPYRTAMLDADLTYADGAAVVLLGRLAGGARMRRAPTTDLGIEVILEAARRLGRAPRIGLLGGNPDRVGRAALALRERYGVETPFVIDGYRNDYGAALVEAIAAELDLMFVGLGMPGEAIWVRRHIDQLPAAPILTCGGWFGFLAGEESRAPGWMQRGGLEWVYRLVQSPKRLSRRYGEGLWSTAVIAIQVIASRLIEALS